MVDRAGQDGGAGLAVCLSYHLPNVSGLSLSAHEVARHVAASGRRAVVVAARHPAEAPRREVLDGVEVRRVPVLFHLGKAPVMPGYARALWRAAGEAAVVNLHLPCLDAATVAVVAKLRGRRLVATHVCSMSRATLADRVIRAAAALPHLVAGLLADRIVVASEDYARASTFCRLFRRKLSVAPLPVPLRLLPGESHPPRAPRPATAERPYRIGYVGRIARQKSLGVLFAALPSILARVGPHVVVDLVGPAREVVGERDWEEILARAEASGGRVRHHGVKAGAELAALYAGLDLLVLPSTDRLESFGLVQIEAMLRRVPVVASDLPGMRVPVALTGLGRLFAPGDPEALAEAVAEVLTKGPPADPGPERLEALFGHATACAPYMAALEEAEAGMGAREGAPEAALRLR